MEPTLIAIVASAIKTARLAQGISQEELALRSGLDRTYISGVERGTRNISLSTLEKLLSALSYSPEYFFQEAFESARSSSGPSELPSK